VRSEDLRSIDQVTPGASDGGLPLPKRPDDDVAFYAEHGWWISPKVFSDDFIDAAERFYRARDRTLPFEDGYSDRGAPQLGLLPRLPRHAGLKRLIMISVGPPARR
jgi:hypothetical protein